MPFQRSLALLLLLLAAVGCRGSRWAKSDPVYAAKYPRHTDNVLKMAKQASDARQVEGRSGYYSGYAMRDDPVAVGWQGGRFNYLDGKKGMVEGRAGLALLVADNDEWGYGGVEVGLRVQSPSRLAPFVGVGAFAGVGPDLALAAAIDTATDSDLVTADNINDYTKVAAAYPEAGVHFWVTPHWRLTASASHYLTTLSDASDFTLYGINLAWLDVPATARPKAYVFRDDDPALSYVPPQTPPLPTAPVIEASEEGADQPLRRLPLVAHEPTPEETPKELSTVGPLFEPPDRS